MRLLPASGQAEVHLTLADGSVVRSLDFDRASTARTAIFTPMANGRCRASGDLAPGLGQDPAQLSRAARPKPRGGAYESRITSHWALFRGDQLVPPARLDQQDGTELVARLMFELPTGWKSVETAWPRIGKQKFRIDDVSRLFDRPTGWMLAGNLGSRRARLGDGGHRAAPQGQGLRRMDTLTLLTFVWPQVQAVFPRNPPKLLLVGARDEMWRGALAGRNSIYLHSNRPLIGESGASPLMRELVQVFAQINDREGSDWLGESLADYYATELLRRAGGSVMTVTRPGRRACTNRRPRSPV